MKLLDNYSFFSFSTIEPTLKISEKFWVMKVLIHLESIDLSEVDKTKLPFWKVLFIIERKAQI